MKNKLSYLFTGPGSIRRFILEFIVFSMAIFVTYWLFILAWALFY